MIEKIKERCDIDAATGCWIWRGAKNQYGYGVMRADGRVRLVHRLALERTGADVAGRDACHHCDVPPCCNPDHLFVGTRAENMADAVRKGRMRSGARHGRAKLTRSQVDAIRYMVEIGAGLQKDIAKQFGVSPMLVTQIKLGRIWMGATQ